MRWVSIAIVALLCASTIPVSSAGDDGHSHHWNGYTLDRGSIPNHVLTDHNDESYSLQTGNYDVVVVAFIFTTCVDVCPVITNNLMQAEEQLDDVDYQFISITVDPATDTPEVLKDYMEGHGATWPHLTGDLEDLQTVWDDFEISVITEEIQSHDHDHNHDHGEDNSTVTVVMPDGTTSSSMVMPNAWDQLRAAADQNGWVVNTSNDGNSIVVTGINNDDSPTGGSWWWELHTWNESAHAWEATTDEIDSVEAGSLAFAPNSTDDATIPMPPDMDNSTFVVVQSDGTSDESVLSQISAWHLSLASLESFSAPKGEFGHYMNAIDGVEAPSDYSWWWQLHYWDMTTSTWNESTVGMDSLYDQTHIAWAPNSTSDEIIPAPSMEMDQEHEEEEIDTSTSHSTQTFILDGDWKPKVVFLGYDWNVDLFVEDVKRAAETTADPHDHEHGLPGFTFTTIAASLGLAIIASSRDE